MLRSPNNHSGSFPDLTTDRCFNKKRKYDEDLSESFNSFTERIMETLNDWKKEFRGETLQMTESLNNIIANDLKLLTDTSMEIKTELTIIRKEYAGLKKTIHTLEDKQRTMQKDIQTLQQSTQFLSDDHDKFKNQLNTLSSNVEPINQLQSDIVELRKQNKLLLNAMNESDQRNRLLNIEIIGLPEFEDEDLTEHIMNIGKKIGVGIRREDIMEVNRVTPRMKTPGRPRLVIAKLKTRFLKDSIIAKSRKNKISTKDCNLSGESKPIFINEHLTIHNKQLLKKCKEVANARQFQFVWIKNGRIYVRKNDTAKQILIAAEEDLQKLI